jgi:hypothetical protein
MAWCRWPAAGDGPAGNAVSAAMVSDLYWAQWHDPAVISVDAGGWHQVEPQPAAEAGGRRVVCTQDYLDHRFGGRPLGDDDFARVAAELGGGGR